VAELKELFEVVTNKVEPDLDAWREQEERHHRRAARKRIAAFAVAAVVVAATIAAAVLLRDGRASTPLGSTTPKPTLSGHASLIAFDVLSGEETLVVDDVEPFRAAVSPDGSHIAFVRTVWRTVQGDPEVFVANIDGTDAKQVTGLPGRHGCCGSFDPAWAPGGDRIAFTRTNEFNRPHIYIVTLATDRVRPLRHEGWRPFESAPAWSPDGDRIAYAAGSVRAKPIGSGRIVAINLLGTTPAPLPLVQERGAIDPSWSPSGRRMVYTAAVPGGTAIFTTDTFGGSHGRRHRLTDGTDDSSPAWSPRGDKIAFTRGNEIAVLTLSTGEVQMLGIGGDPSWSPDASTVYAWRA
jgi:Tol biopolymer transport system component